MTDGKRDERICPQHATLYESTGALKARLDQCVTTKTFGIFMASLTVVFIAMFSFSIQMSTSASNAIAVRALEQATELQRLALAQNDVRLDLVKLQTSIATIVTDTSEIKRDVRDMRTVGKGSHTRSEHDPNSESR